ncbi:hypothetical protein [Leptospira sp. GIMC2001]|uniref:hypothetical protein n=1 Tax=Leptospira sp. GIMC2001 TaxID=1513297 RepID=UPI00234AA3E1|nr:hypothetical protein [Leptospira sp. GIMC2001]WCL47558.1 hypothetical protein O4O04_00915 [Leptospira sp. GIMC2001]
MTPIRIFFNLELGFRTKFDRQPKSNSPILFFVLIAYAFFIVGCSKSIEPRNVSFYGEYFDLELLIMNPERNKIQILELHAKEFNNKDLEKLPSLPELSILSIRGTQISELKSLSITKFPKLATILANETNLDDAGILNWQNPPVLTKLNFANTKIQNPTWLALFPKLRNLNIENTGVASINEIINCPDLVNLWLADTSVVSIKPLYSLQNLNYVSIDSLPIPDEELKEFRKELPYAKLVRRGSIF